MLARTVCTGLNLMLARPNCPVLDAWAKLDVQTALVLLGAYFRPRIRRVVTRVPPLHPRTSVFSALSLREIPLAELAFIVMGFVVIVGFAWAKGGHPFKEIASTSTCSKNRTTL